MPRVTSQQEGLSFEEFGQNVRAQRNMRGWSLEFLAKRAGIAPHTLLRMEQGLPSTRKSRVAVAFALGMSYDRLNARKYHGRTDVSVHEHEDEWWSAMFDHRKHVTEENVAQMQQLDERVRLGQLGFVQQFVKLLNCRLPQGRLLPGVIEVHDDIIPSMYLGGEVFAYILRGSVILHLDGETFFLEEGQATTFDCTKPFFFGPGKNARRGVPSHVLYVRLDEAPRGSRARKEDALDGKRFGFVSDLADPPAEKPKAD